jgi:hypothetical protein
MSAKWWIGAALVAVTVAGASVAAAASLSVSSTKIALSSQTVTPAILTYSAIGAAASRTNNGSITVNYPASTASNDLILLVEINNANSSATTPSGWTLLADQGTSSPSQFHFTVWSKLAAGESSVALTVTTNANGAAAWAIRYTRPGGYPANPASATATVRSGVATSATTMTPATNLTTSANDARVMSIVAIRAANTLSLSSAQGFALQTTTTGTTRALGIADQYVATSGTTPTSPTWSQSGTAAQWAWATVAFS